MPSNYPKYLLQALIAFNGDFVIPPETQEMAGDGRLSINKGWDVETSTPLEQGGIAPRREDFNGALYLLSQFALWQQQGGLMNYSSSLNYEVGNEILLNGVKYRALKENGPNSKKVVPGTDPKTWKNMDANVPAGSVIPFANVTLGGSDGRRPIFWGQSDADEGWVICDGGAGVGNTKVPNLIGKFIKGESVVNQGQTGGNENVTLTETNIPSHTHAITIQNAGGHTHTRGSMEIEAGGLGVNGPTLDWAGGLTGAFYKIKSYSGKGNGSYGAYDVGFKASKAWSGQTSNNGSHTHSVTCSNTGSGTPVSIVPPFYSLAYFVKLPE